MPNTSQLLLPGWRSGSDKVKFLRLRLSYSEYPTNYKFQAKSTRIDKVATNISYPPIRVELVAYTVDKKNKNWHP